MYDVWIVAEESGRYEPVTKVPQNHKTVPQAFLCATRMVKLLGAEFLKAKNVTVRGVHPSHCILIFDPTGNTKPSPDQPPMAAVIVGAELQDEEGNHSLEGSETHTAHIWH